MGKSDAGPLAAADAVASRSDRVRYQFNQTRLEGSLVYGS